MFPHGFWASPLWKEAARAGLRQISQMVGQGNLSGASRLATTPGVLKPSAAGSQIQHLGRGNEGLATMVAHPEHGVAVRKLYDPRGISSPSMIARKEEVGRALGNNPDFAAFKGSAPTPGRQSTMHFSEFVPQAKGTTSSDDWTPQSFATSQRANKALKGVGYEGHDIRPGNMIQDSRTGQNKLVDYIPARAGEMSSSPASPEKIEVSPAGGHLFNDPSRTGPDTTGGMLGRLLGNKTRPSPNLANEMSFAKTRVSNPGLGVAPTAIGTPPSLGGLKTSPLKTRIPSTTPTTPQKPIQQKPLQPSTSVMRRPQPVTTPI